MKRDHVSFDVFDTCLIRRCGLPHKIWDLMADRLFDKDDSRARLSFTGNRSYVEEQISKFNPFPSLRDIYEKLNVAQWGLDQNTIMNLEMEIEEQELFPNPQMHEIVNDFRKKGFTIAFISDMYLPTEFIKKILVKFGFCREDENVFVSADCKAVKFDGKLFDFVLRKTGTKAKQWIHYGDDERSDYSVPKSKGIKANCVRTFDFTNEEKRWLDDARFYAHKHEIELWAGLCRLTRLQNEQNFAATMAVDFVASVYVPYVKWVLKTAKEKDIKKLYFLARDSHIFMEIAKAMGAEDDGIECRYLKVSRQSIYKCVFYDVSDYELEITIGFIRNQTVKKTLDFIGINYDQLSVTTKEKFAADYVLGNEKINQSFRNTLKKNDSNLIKEQSKQYRQLFIQYLRQENVLDGINAFVDLGWAGSSRCALNYIINREECLSVPTFYWGCNRELIYGKTEDELFVFQKQYDLSELYSYSFMFFEHYASMNSCGSTTGYRIGNENVESVENAVVNIDEYIIKINEKITSVLALKLFDINVTGAEAFYDIFLCCGLKQLDGMLKKPSNKIMSFFSRIRIENFGKTLFLIRRLSIRNTIALLVWGEPAKKLWLEASLIKTFGPFAGAFTKLYKHTSKTAIANRLRLWWENRD